jgi:hypothetical protein
MGDRDAASCNSVSVVKSWLTVMSIHSPDWLISVIPMIAFCLIDFCSSYDCLQCVWFISIVRWIAVRVLWLSVMLLITCSRLIIRPTYSDRPLYPCALFWSCYVSSECLLRQVIYVLHSMWLVACSLSGCWFKPDVFTFQCEMLSSKGIIGNI